MELNDHIIDLLVDFDEMGFAPTTMCPDPEAYAIEWRNKITNAIKELTEENERLSVCTKILTTNNADLEAELALIYDLLEESKADTVRKMQERLKAETITIQDHTGKLGSVVIVGTIDQIAKEMLEGGNE